MKTDFSYAGNKKSVFLLFRAYIDNIRFYFLILIRII